MPRLRTTLLGLLAFAASGAPALAADAATDFVRGLYEGEAIYNPLEEEAGGPSLLTGPALKALQASQRESEEAGGLGCIDFVVTISGQDWDDATVRKTLTVERLPGGSDAEPKVAAHFVAFAFDGIPEADQEKITILYDLEKVGADWRIADMASEPADGSVGWRLSELCSQP